MRTIISFLFIVFSLNLFAADITLTTVSNNDPKDQSTYAMVIEVNSSNEIVRFHKDEFSKTRRIERLTYELSQIYEGYIFEEQRGMEVLKLKALTFDSFQGGEAQLRYLYDGRPLAGTKYKSIDLHISNINGVWSLRTPTGTIVKTIFFKVRKKFPLGVIGIEPQINK